MVNTVRLLTLGLLLSLGFTSSQAMYSSAAAGAGARRAAASTPTEDAEAFVQGFSALLHAMTDSSAAGMAGDVYTALRAKGMFDFVGSQEEINAVRRLVAFPGEASTIQAFKILGLDGHMTTEKGGRATAMLLAKSVDGSTILHIAALYGNYSFICGLVSIFVGAGQHCSLKKLFAATDCMNRMPVDFLSQYLIDNHCVISRSGRESIEHLIKGILGLLKVTDYMYPADAEVGSIVVAGNGDLVNITVVEGEEESSSYSLCSIQ